MVVNPNSRSGRDPLLEQCVNKLQAAGIECQLAQSASPAEARARITQAAPTVGLIVLAGGDGTISSVAAALQQVQVPFALLPFGTANDLARSLGLPQDPLAACDAIIEGRIRCIDLGSVNGRVFFNAAHIGLGVKITHELTPDLKKTWGVFSYFRAFSKALGRARSFAVSLTVDRKRMRLRAMHVGIGNGRFYGGGNVIDHECFIDDGKLSVFVLKPQSVWDLLTLAPLLRAGAQRFTKQTFASRGRCIEVVTRRPMEIHADGEPVGTTPAVFKVVAQALQVVCPVDTEHLSDQNQQPMVKVMEWLRNDQQVCINDLLIAAKESVVFFEDAAESASKPELKTRLHKLASLRTDVVARIERYLESQGELTVMPDPDAEWGSKMLNHLAAKLATDEDRAIIEQRLKSEEHVKELLREAQAVDFDENFRPLLDDFVRNNDLVMHDLRSHLSPA